jgi:hypothetical protein
MWWKLPDVARRKRTKAWIFPFHIKGSAEGPGSYRKWQWLPLSPPQYTEIIQLNGINGQKPTIAPPIPRALG